MKGKSLKHILQIASVYVGTVIGAGFASGQEMIQFFTRFGYWGILGLVVSGILYSFIGAIVLEIVYEKQFTSYDGLIKQVTGRGLGELLKWSVIMFLFVCFSAMIAGAGAILEQQMGITSFVGSVAMTILCLLTFLSGSKGFIRMNSLLVPVLCIGGIVLSVYIMVSGNQPVFSFKDVVKLRNSWILSMFLYVSYNILPVIVVMASIGNTLSSRKVARWSGIIGGSVLGLLGLAIGIVTLLYYNSIQALEIPMLGVLLDYPQFMQWLYIGVLVLAMYTTAIANGYAVIENVFETTTWNKYLIIVGIGVLGLIGAHMGFSTIVAYIFPIFGYIGCFEIIMLIVYYRFMKRE